MIGTSRIVFGVRAVVLKDKFRLNECCNANMCYGQVRTICEIAVVPRNCASVNISKRTPQDNASYIVCARQLFQEDLKSGLSPL